ncbi:hypothetical protein RSAG8_05916, partial [Rhizoctonia solani AG-8 WAC10335]
MLIPSYYLSAPTSSLHECSLAQASESYTSTTVGQGEL